MLKYKKNEVLEASKKDVFDDGYFRLKVYLLGSLYNTPKRG